MSKTLSLAAPEKTASLEEWWAWHEAQMEAIRFLIAILKIRRKK